MFYHSIDFVLRLAQKLIFVLCAFRFMSILTFEREKIFRPFGIWYCLKYISALLRKTFYSNNNVTTYLSKAIFHTLFMFFFK